MRGGNFTLYTLRGMNKFWHVESCARLINCAEFQLDRFRGFGAPGGRKSLSAIDWRITLTTVYALTCYTVIILLLLDLDNRVQQFLYGTLTNSGVSV